ncbi:E3 ubiquitin-protein transferase rmnd5b [Phytophthora pseudosyringae]|uniref:E3 ubiquitin-protein transferase rmnd5b n=1 Tax=Phytophthora pseudosyringae TaxID=221518 RepID=A0A8T1W8L5_9STRA|nr:E3 ubiquitin-protein transferase rmnd5b [Phytophthora pseudosyringae]
MQALEEESSRVLKRQRLCVAQIDRQLDELLTHVETTKQQLEDRQLELRRKKNRHLASSSAGEGEEGSPAVSANAAAQASSPAANDDAVTPSDGPYNAEDAEAKQDDVAVEEQDNETEYVVRDFIKRVRQLNVEKNVASELKAIHVLLSKYSKQIDKNLCTDITKVCRRNELDQKLVCRLVAEYLYQDGQIEAADALCKEAGLELPPTFRECFIELHQILKAIKEHDMQPALDWARKHRKELGQLDIDIEFELVRLKYVDILESSPDMMDAVNFANKELAYFHQTHAEEVGVLMSCVLYKGKLEESPYKKLFNDDRWDGIHDAVIRACCRLRRVPYRSYLETCLSAGVSALPAMHKLVSVMDSKMGGWSSMEELPVEIPIAKELRFHNVFSCPVSKEENTPENPPILLKCGHVICRSCVKRFSYNMTRRFKCPTCPVEQTESETRKLFF